MMYFRLLWTSAKRLVALCAIASLLATVQAGKAWAIIEPESAGEEEYPHVISDSGPNSNPRIIRTLIGPNWETRSRFATITQAVDERDVDGIGMVWDQTVSDERYELFESNGVPQTTLIDVAGETWDYFNEIFHSTDGFISHRQNETTGEGYSMDIQGTLNPFVPGSWKLRGLTDLYICDTDEVTNIDTFTAGIMHDSVFQDQKQGYELLQFLTTEAVEWTRTEYWYGAAGEPAYWGWHSLTTSGIDYFSADGPGVVPTVGPQIEEPSSEMFLDDLLEENVDADESDFQPCP